ncbi:MAG TPA: PAS domain S-box protein [Bacillota bacterium]|nr:PAS domain S-box protein [Bacillota bacterium]HPT86934.1 PAS domain S-box protein [Bacillota bacterium]
MLNKIKIFIVEDASIVALDLKRSLLNMGYEVVGMAPSGEEAVSRILKAEPDLVMMDIKLKGGLDGIETAAILRSHLDIPVVYLTAYSDGETLERAKMTDPFGYIIKPFDERELQTIIEMALYKHAINKKLKESEKWLATTINSIGDAVIATDKTGQVIFLNPIAERLTGWSQSEAYRKPLSEVFQIVSETTGNPEKNPFDKVMEMGSVAGLDNHTLLIHKDGHRIPIDDSAAPIKDEAGNIIGVVLIFRDITERRQTEQELEKNEARYRSIMEQSVEGIYLVDAETKTVLEANAAFAKMLGYELDELVGLSVYELLDHREDSVDQRLSQLVIEEQPVRDERRYRCKDGTLIELQVSAGLITYGDRRVVCTLTHDISERKRAEESLRESERRFRRLFQAIPDLMIRIDAQGNVLDVKPALEFDSVLILHDTKGTDLYTALPEHIRNDFRQLVERAFTLEEIQIYEYQFSIGNENSEREVRVVPISAGEALLIIRDITERKKMERQLKYLSLHDSLTGIYNRTYFEEEIRRLEMTGQSKVGIIVCDLDGLKLVNDTLGHERGDILLKAAATVIKESIFQSDFVARIGGDEFAILIQDNDPKIVEAVCNRIRENVIRYNQQHSELPLNISFGFAVNRSESAKIPSVFKEADDNMYREKLYRSKSTRSTIVQAMMKVLEVKDFITEGHAHRLHDLILRLAQAIGLPEPSVTNLRLLAQFHDIGKVGTPDRVLFKPGALDPNEKKEIQRHAEIGNRIAKSIPELEPIADWILMHHEWWNGEGYPLGLKGEDIPLESRILAIADAYDAMTSDRPYRKAMSHKEAIVEIQKGAGKQFDPTLVTLFVQLLEENQ